MLQLTVGVTAKTVGTCKKLNAYFNSSTTVTQIITNLPPQVICVLKYSGTRKKSGNRFVNPQVSALAS